MDWRPIFVSWPLKLLYKGLKLVPGNQSERIQSPQSSGDRLAYQAPSPIRFAFPFSISTTFRTGVIPVCGVFWLVAPSNCKMEANMASLAAQRFQTGGIHSVNLRRTGVRSPGRSEDGAEVRCAAENGMAFCCERRTVFTMTVKNLYQPQLQAGRIHGLQGILVCWR